MNNQVIQLLQVSMDDLKEIIKEAVLSVIPPPPTKNLNLGLNDSDSIPDDDLLTTKEVSVILKVSSTSLWRYNKQGVLKIKNKIGRKVYYSKKDVFDFIKGNVI
ncbi:helix-turn-helix domain-containing protein [Algibacter luteus]|uniref:Helix-turn-helix domain-containing protein n=1 Tax=Algibacter luteus TaxID=1178825 RepID=A0A1M6FFS5_9FLAO|nr:helix-turn-helix domain-containing protein [Algibacter luteus]SHI96507.1 Helix-turn-helix domain-containing protein [Algibacter luteus]